MVATETEIIEKLLDEWTTLLPQVQLQRQEREAPAGDLAGIGRYDLVLDVEVGGVKQRLVCEVKSVGEPRYLHQAISFLKMATAGQKGVVAVLLAPYISAEGRALCREAGVNYIDLAGNIFLRFDLVLIDKTSTHKPTKTSSGAPPDIFARKSSRVLRVLLENPGQPWKLAGLSQESQVSEALAFRVVGVLADKGYVDKKRGSISLQEPGQLLDLWAGEYRVGFITAQTYYSFKRTFRAFADDMKALAEPRDLKYAFTLHAGASLVAPFVRFTDVHLYCQGDVEMLVKGLDLRPVEVGGTIHILTPYDEGVFYRVHERDGLSVVCNTQLYLDLIKYPARGQEQARFLRQQKMEF